MNHMNVLSHHYTDVGSRHILAQHTVEPPVYYGHLGTNQKCPDYQGVLIFQVSLYDKAPFGTVTKCADYI